MFPTHVAPNAYEADSMLGKTVRSGKLRAPTYIIEGRAKTADLLKLKVCLVFLLNPNKGVFVIVYFQQGGNCLLPTRRCV